jgi:hypothetical protein
MAMRNGEILVRRSKPPGDKWTAAAGFKHPLGRIQMARIELADMAETGAGAPNAMSADVLFELGMMYCIGREVPQDFVAAHKWFNLAAMKGSQSAKEYRCEISREMTTTQIAEAQRQARHWLTLN